MTTKFEDNILYGQIYDPINCVHDKVYKFNIFRPLGTPTMIGDVLMSPIGNYRISAEIEKFEFMNKKKGILRFQINLTKDEYTLYNDHIDKDGLYFDMFIKRYTKKSSEYIDHDKTKCVIYLECKNMYRLDQEEINYTMNIELKLMNFDPTVNESYKYSLKLERSFNKLLIGPTTEKIIH